MLTLIAALAALLLPAWPYSQSVESGGGLDVLWRNEFWKQVSGFTLLGLSAVAAFLSLRKRIGWLSFGGFEGWRLVHAGVGLARVAALFAHTGFRLGHNLNSWLMIDLHARCAAGRDCRAASWRVEHRLMNGPMRGAATPPRRIPVWMHILAFWPLPVLLAFTSSRSTSIREPGVMLTRKLWLLWLFLAIAGGSVLLAAMVYGGPIAPAISDRRDHQRPSSDRAGLRCLP